MYTAKYITTNTKPEKFDSLGNGFWYYNYNISETDDSYTFLQVRINGKPDFTKCFNEVLKSFVDEENINLYDVLLLYGSDNQIEEIRQNVQMDFENLDEVQIEKNKIFQKISEKDLSNQIKKFIINNVEGWYDKYQRVALKNMIEIQKSKNQETTTLWLGDTDFVLTCDRALEILNDVEIYASQCLNVTNNHKKNVNKLSTIDDIKNYDYESGYPDILSFEI